MWKYDEQMLCLVHSERVVALRRADLWIISDSYWTALELTRVSTLRRTFCMFCQCDRRVVQYRRGATVARESTNLLQNIEQNGVHIPDIKHVLLCHEDLLLVVVFQRDLCARSPLRCSTFVRVT